MSDIEYVDLGPGDYERAKKVLDKARHPGFVGRELFFRCATQGRATVAVVDGQDLAVALVAKGKLNALSVCSAAQGKGLGTGLVRKLQPRWVRSIVERVSFFERLGYAPVGPASVGANGKRAVQLMELMGAVGDVGRADSPVETSREAKPSPREELESRARAAGLMPGKTPSVAQRVDFIADLMEELLFDGTKTNRMLAEMWGVAASTVENSSAEASRRVTSDPESARRDITAGARRLYRQTVRDGDAKGARAIGELWANVSGARAQVSALDSGGGNVEATAEELRQALEEAGYEVRKKDDGKRSSEEAGNDDE